MESERFFFLSLFNAEIYQILNDLMVYSGMIYSSLEGIIPDWKESFQSGKTYSVVVWKNLTGVKNRYNLGGCGKYDFSVSPCLLDLGLGIGDWGLGLLLHHCVALMTTLTIIMTIMITRPDILTLRTSILSLIWFHSG